MDNGKSVSVPLRAHFKVSLKDYLSNDWDMERMSKVPYANAIGSLMYLMVCTRPHIAYAVSIGTADVGLVYGRNQGKHVDVGCKGSTWMLTVSWMQIMPKTMTRHVVALSTIEVEYMALTEAVKESIWLKGLLIELAVNLKTKHINVRYHFIKEIVESKEIEVAKIGTKDNAADAFTKVVPGPKFKYCMKILGVGAN
ncbi:hypothetical protein Tco_0303106 [Tanacetum coccineum]